MFNDNMHKSSSNINSSSVKKGISPTYEMAKEPRFFRRILSENITQQIKCFSKHSLSSQLFIMPLPCKEKGYILLQLRSGKIPEKIVVIMKNTVNGDNHCLRLLVVL